MRALFFNASIFCLLLSGAAGCASGSRANVVHTERDTLSSIGTAKEEPDARLEAIEAAQEYCEQRGERTVFQEQDLKGEGKKPEIDLKKIPVIGKVLKGSDKSQVVVGFRCDRQAEKNAS